jgi:carbon-monoxide dehydrogenase medium subunit
MYPRAFRYYRAKSLQEATTLLAELGTDAKVLAGGQSLLPLMKLRLSNPTNLVDLGFIPKLAYN